jgi:hypothetical protein
LWNALLDMFLFSVFLRVDYHVLVFLFLRTLE